ncbi:MAG: beta-galactosidase [Anaerolineae bacterium]|nr:beta-galactosidase [Anaerolineae bacterium]
MFYFGVDYYPEHWPEERWPEDARLMAEAGFNVVRLAEFAWSKLEPRQGEYDFAWLDRAIALLHERGIRVILGTPTASPPPWLMAGHPDIFRVGEDGRRVTFGNRREYCPNHPVYHEYTRHIVTRMAAHYADHPAVIGWQIDNELGDRCYCPLCARAFQDWLRRRYGSLDVLNQRWGTTFWSHVYTDWEQIPLPLATGGSPNPGLALDFFRFSSDSTVAYQQLQVDILRQRCPRHVITHNFMGFRYDRINYFDLARPLDVVAWDNYPRTQWAMQAGVDPSQMALAADTMRGLKGRNFWVMEQQAGSGGWEIVSVPPRPGELRLWAYQAIAHGADAILFFRWRTARWGTEQYWHGLLDHDGHPGRRYQEIKGMGAEIRRVGEHIAGAVVKAAVAIILSYDSRFAFQVQANNPEFNYPEHLQQIYRAFHCRHVPLDIVAPDAGLSNYRLVVAPALHIVSEAIAENLKRFVQAGGVLVVTPRSGVKDESNTVVNERLPGLLARLCGVQVEEYDSLPPGASRPLAFAVPELTAVGSPRARVWCDILSPAGAEVVARYGSDYYAGKAAITRHRFGKGWAVYVGTVGDAPLYEALAGWLLGLAGVSPCLGAPREVEVTERWQGQQRLLFLLNHSEQEQTVALDGHYTDMLSGARAPTGSLALAPRDIRVLMSIP